ncbi:COG4315 family predicted lipoprotein [Actinoplanes subtropicus]|uniref:COG4315 family predicted lipoprotein n=1 Tax=Actinoplanes subtropicus TaxID=543632 RepID=UPI0004C37D2E|nr:hypothetical protein [Actinoplanes subtropicus]
MQKTLVVAGAVALLSLSACGAKTEARPAAKASAPAGGPEVRVQQTALGEILTDQGGRTLYAFVPDKQGFGSCKLDCQATWPPFVSGQKPKAGQGVDPALLTVIPTGGGVEQVKYAGWPLYTYVPDVGPGDVDGQGEENGLWWVVGADGKLIKKSAAE